MSILKKVKRIITRSNEILLTIYSYKILLNDMEKSIKGILSTYIKMLTNHRVHLDPETKILLHNNKKSYIWPNYVYSYFHIVINNILLYICNFNESNRPKLIQRVAVRIRNLGVADRRKNIKSISIKVKYNISLAMLVGIPSVNKEMIFEFLRNNSNWLFYISIVFSFYIWHKRCKNLGIKIQEKDIDTYLIILFARHIRKIFCILLLIFISCFIFDFFLSSTLSSTSDNGFSVNSSLLINGNNTYRIAKLSLGLFIVLTSLAISILENKNRYISWRIAFLLISLSYLFFCFYLLYDNDLRELFFTKIKDWSLVIAYIIVTIFNSNKEVMPMNLISSPGSQSSLEKAGIKTSHSDPTRVVFIDSFSMDNNELAEDSNKGTIDRRSYIKNKKGELILNPNESPDRTRFRHMIMDPAYMPNKDWHISPGYTSSRYVPSEILSKNEEWFSKNKGVAPVIEDYFHELDKLDSVVKGEIFNQWMLNKLRAKMRFTEDWTEFVYKNADPVQLENLMKRVDIPTAPLIWELTQRFNFEAKYSGMSKPLPGLIGNEKGEFTEADKGKIAKYVEYKTSGVIRNARLFLIDMNNAPANQLVDREIVLSEFATNKIKDDNFRDVNTKEGQKYYIAKFRVTRYQTLFLSIVRDGKSLDDGLNDAYALCVSQAKEFLKKDPTVPLPEVQAAHSGYKKPIYIAAHIPIYNDLTADNFSCKAYQKLKGEGHYGWSTTPTPLPSTAEKKEEILEAMKYNRLHRECEAVKIEYHKTLDTLRDDNIPESPSLIQRRDELLAQMNNLNAQLNVPKKYPKYPGPTLPLPIWESGDSWGARRFADYERRQRNLAGVQKILQKEKWERIQAQISEERRLQRNEIKNQYEYIRRRPEARLRAQGIISWNSDDEGYSSLEENKKKTNRNKRKRK